MKMRRDLFFLMWAGLALAGLGVLGAEEEEVGAAEEASGDEVGVEETVVEESAMEEGEDAEDGLDMLRVKERSYAGKVVVIPIQGDDDLINKGKFQFVRRMLERANEEGAEAIIVDINTPGGNSWESSGLMMEDLSRLDVPTYAFINTRAASAGSIIALGTDAIYMAPTSSIGAALTVMAGGQDVGETMEKKLTSFNKAQVRSVAKKKGHRVEIAEGFVSDDKDVVVQVGEDERDEYPMGVLVLAKKGEVLSLDHEQATRVFEGKPVLAKGIAEDVDDLVAQEGLTGEIVMAKPLGFESIAMWVTRLAPILIIVAIAGAYMEYNAPGFGLPGIVSVVAFSIFFFGHYLAGRMAGFEIVALFVLGIVLIGVEIFLFPGVILIGLAGVLMVLGALLYTMAGSAPDGGTFSINTEGLGGAARNLVISLVGAAVLIAVL
ncbi:MAG: hypothetical protein AAF591_23495, partial [Verrucomicrobiota bacterium]